MTGAVVLAAGAGTRLGSRAKALLPIDRQTFLERIVSTGRDAGITDWLIVIGKPHAAAVAREAARLGVATVENPAPERGMASSVSAGFSEALARWSFSSALLWPVDTPLCTIETVRTLLAADPEVVIVPTFDGRGGHPARIPRALWAELAACTGEPEGARTVLARADKRRLVVTDPGVVRDFDTPEDLS